MNLKPEGVAKGGIGDNYPPPPRIFGVLTIPPHIILGGYTGSKRRKLQGEFVKYIFFFNFIENVWYS